MADEKKISSRENCHVTCTSNYIHTFTPFPIQSLIRNLGNFF